MYTLKQKKEAYKNLPSEVQDFIMDNETTELIENYLKESGLNEDQSNSADSEILYAMYGLQSLDEAIDTISKITNKSLTDLYGLKSKLESNIFSKIHLNMESGVSGEDRRKIVSEISQKYGLNQSQEETLLNSALKDASILSKTIESNLNVSSILAEQIVEDLSKRLFNTTPRKIETPQKQESITIDSVKSPVVNTIPEIRPVNLPMVEKNEPVRVIPPFQNEVLDKQTPSLNIGVPRYADNVSSVSVGKNFSSNSGSIIDQKMNSVTPGITEAPKKYDKDPYREELG